MKSEKSEKNEKNEKKEKKEKKEKNQKNQKKQKKKSNVKEPQKEAESTNESKIFTDSLKNTLMLETLDISHI